MGRHGENIRYRKSDNRWEGRYKVYHKEKGRYVYRSVYGHTYEEVKEKLLTEKLSFKRLPAEKLVARSTQPAGISGESDSIALFSQAAGEWLEYVRKKCKYSTYAKYNTLYKTHIAGLLEDCPLTDVTDTRLQAELPEDLSENTLKNIYCIVNQILRYVNTHYYANIPELAGINAHIGKKLIETLSVSEQTKLFDCLYTKTDKYKVAVSFSLCLGLRLGEICALKWTDINLANSTMTINHTVQRLPVTELPEETTRTNLLEGDPKSGCSKRVVPLSHKMLHMLEQIPNGQRYIFGGERPLDPRTMQYQFKRILKEAAISSRNFHVLRHTFATNCVEKGIDVKSLSEILGHSDVKITLNRYVHPTMDAKRLQMEQLTQFYDQIHGQAL